MIGQIYFAYDEDSLALHSNAGLIRRAKKSLDDVQLLQGNAAPLQFKVEEFEVVLPEQGITEARCNCPAQSCCKHILSSIFWLQQNQNPIEKATEQSNEDHNKENNNHSTENIDAPVEPTAQITTASNVQNSALEIALTLKDSTLFKKAGKAQTRLAFEIWQSFCHNADSCHIEILPEKISFKTTFSDNAILFFPSTGFEGILSDLADNKKNAVHLACIAYLFQQYAPEQWQWSEDLQLQVSTPQHVLSPEDLQFIQELQQLLQSFIQHGLSHLAKESVLSLHILNMQARAQNLPRLAAQLRQLHGMMQQCLDNDVQMDEQQVFSQLAYLNAYLFALQNSQNQAEIFNRLKGAVQRDYQDHSTERLIPLGCEWWQTDSGAHGLTITFWDVAQQHSREVTQARANHLDSTFSKDSAAQSGIWGTSLDYLLKHQLQLTVSKTSNATNLSASADTRFNQLDDFKALSLDDFNQMNIGISRWSTLSEWVHPKSSLEQNPYRYLLLRHQKILKPELNEYEQCFECRVQDDDEHYLKLSLPIEVEYQSRIKHLTTLINQNEKIVATLVRLDTSQQNIQLIPCSVFLQKNGQLEIFSLDYHHPRHKKSSLGELITGRIEKLLQQKKQWQTQQHYSALDIATQQTQSVLEFYANTGRAVLDPEDRLKLQQAAQLYEDLGLDILHHSLQASINTQNLSADLLKWRHLFLQIQRLSYRLPIEKMF